MTYTSSYPYGTRPERWGWERSIAWLRRVEMGTQRGMGAGLDSDEWGGSELERLARTFLEEEDEGRAADVLGRLLPIVLPKARRELSQRFACSAEHREDALTIAVTRLWVVRRQIEWQGANAFGNLLRKIATNALLSILRKEKDKDASEPEIAVSPPTPPWLDVDKLAGEVMLGWPEDVSMAERDLRVFAAQLYWLDRLPWAEIQPLVSGPRRPVSREEFDRWVMDPATLKDLAFRELMVKPEEVVRSILNLDVAPELGPLVAHHTGNAAAGPGIGEWTAREVVMIVLRLGYGSLAESIVAREDLNCSKDELDALVDRCRNRLPFLRITQDLIEALKPHPDKILADGWLWRRLAFEYWYRHEIPQKDILLRLAESATCAGYPSFNQGNLTVWLSNNRLLEALRKRLREMGEDL